MDTVENSYEVEDTKEVGEYLAALRRYKGQILTVAAIGGRDKLPRGDRPAAGLSLVGDDSGAGAGGAARPRSLHDHELRRRAHPGHQPAGDDAGRAAAARRQVRPVSKVSRPSDRRRDPRPDAQGHQALDGQRRHLGPEQRAARERDDRLHDLLRCAGAGAGGAGRERARVALPERERQGAPAERRRDDRVPRAGGGAAGQADSGSIEANLADFKRRNVGRMPDSSAINMQLADRTEADVAARRAGNEPAAGPKALARSAAEPDHAQQPRHGRRPCGAHV